MSIHFQPVLQTCNVRHGRRKFNLKQVFLVCGAYPPDLLVPSVTDQIINYVTIPVSVVFPRENRKYLTLEVLIPVNIECIS